MRAQLDAATFEAAWAAGQALPLDQVITEAKEVAHAGHSAPHAQPMPAKSPYPPIAGRYAYRLNGHVGTDNAFSFKYGVAAARIKFPRCRGQHGKLLVQPLGGMYPGGTGHEIDVIEFFGETPTSAAVSSATSTATREARIVKTGANIPDTFLHGPRDGWGKKFHVFSVQWTPRSLIFRIDGKETWRVGGRISRVPQYLILSLLSSDYELPKIQDRQLPQHTCTSTGCACGRPAAERRCLEP